MAGPFFMGALEGRHVAWGGFRVCALAGQGAAAPAQAGGAASADAPVQAGGWRGKGKKAARRPCRRAIGAWFTGPVRANRASLQNRADWQRFVSASGAADVFPGRCRQHFAWSREIGALPYRRRVPKTVADRLNSAQRAVRAALKLRQVGESACGSRRLAARSPSLSTKNAPAMWRGHCSFTKLCSRTGCYLDCASASCSVLAAAIRACRASSWRAVSSSSSRSSSLLWL